MAARMAGALLVVVLAQLLGPSTSSSMSFIPAVNVKAAGGLDKPMRSEGLLRKEAREEDVAKVSQPQTDRQRACKYVERAPSFVLDRTPSGIAAITGQSDGCDSFHEADDDVPCADLRGFAESFKESAGNRKTLGLLGASAMVYSWTTPSGGEELAIKVNHKGKDLDMFRELLVLQHLRSHGLDRAPARITRLRKGTLLPVGDGEYGMVMRLEAGINPTPGIWRLMPWPAKVDHLKSFAVTLGTLHERGCVHRDVKRGNVLSDASGVVLIDFTSMTCKSANGLDTLGSYKVSGKKGTRYCRAPEAADDAVDGDALTSSADAFSMGLYSLDVLLGQALELKFMGQSGGTLDGERLQEQKYLEHVCGIDWQELVAGVKAKCEDLGEGDARCVEAIGRVCEGLLQLDPTARRTCLWAAQELAEAQGAA